MIHTIGISELAVSASPEDELVTHSLGSCLGLALHDPVVRLGGLVHCLLPLSSLDAAMAQRCPASFVDTGVVALLRAMVDRGAVLGRLSAKVVGCADMYADHALFRVGERNYTVLRKVLWKNRILIAAQDVGGTVARSVSLQVGSGRVVVRSQGCAREL